MRPRGRGCDPADRTRPWGSSRYTSAEGLTVIARFASSRRATSLTLPCSSKLERTETSAGLLATSCHDDQYLVKSVFRPLLDGSLTTASTCFSVLL